MDTERAFLGAIEETIQDSSTVYVPCIYSVEQDKVIWIANFCNQSIEKAVYIANAIAELLEEDFNQYMKTGKKNYELSMLLERTGTFDDGDGCCSNDIREECKARKESQEHKITKIESSKQMN